MNVTDVVDFLVSVEVDFPHPNSVEFVGLNHGDTRRNLLCLKTGVHLIDCLVGNLFDLGSHSVAFLRNFNRNIREVDTVHSVFVSGAKLLVSVHFRSLGICCINDSELAVLHTQLQEFEKRAPHNGIVVGVNGFLARNRKHRARAKHSDIISGQRVILQPVLLNPG